MLEFEFFLIVDFFLGKFEYLRALSLYMKSALNSSSTTVALGRSWFWVPEAFFGLHKFYKGPTSGEYLLNASLPLSLSLITLFTFLLFFSIRMVILKYP